MNDIVIHNSLKTFKNYNINDFINDINNKRPFSLHEQRWYRTALQTNFNLEIILSLSRCAHMLLHCITRIEVVYFVGKS